MQEEQAQEEEQTQDGQTCPGCGISKEDWKGNNGEGFSSEGQMHCCQGCAEGSGCTCA